MTEKNEIIIIEPLLAEMFMKKVTGWAMLPDERATYYLWEAIHTIIFIPEIEEKIRQKFGNNYINRINNINKKMGTLRELKILLDHLDEHAIKKMDTESNTWKKTIKILHEEQNTIETTGLYILTIICQNTNIGKWTLKNTDQQIYTREYKKFTDYTPNNQKNTQNNQNTTQTGGQNKWNNYTQ